MTTQLPILTSNNTHRFEPSEVAAHDSPLRGRALRFVLVDEIRRRATMTVAEMVDVVAGYGFALGGRASKVISDALRWELARGRVTRLQRGVYRYRRAPATTVRRIRICANQCRTWIVAARRHQPPPPAPPDRRRPPGLAPNDPTRPPWEHMGWLWTT